MTKHRIVPKGKKATRGEPLLYNETKKRYNFSLTPTAHQVLADLANAEKLTLSEFLERHLRRIGGLPIPIHIK